jgi:LysM repeat protein
VISGALNIGFIAAFIAFSMQDRPSLGFGFAHDSSVSEGVKLSNPSVLSSFAKLSFRELVALLTNRELVEEGYAKRDLALSALVAFHHFNLEKALGASVQQKRDIFLEHGSVDLYPGLSNEQFDAMIRFAYQEKWPLTSQGLFSLLQKNVKDETLASAFLITPESYALQLLFQKTQSPQDPSTLLRLSLEGNWELLDSFAKEQQQLLDFSIEKRRRLLLSYLAHKSSTAAELLLKTDFSFVEKRLDDRGILDVLALLNHRTKEAEEFCQALANSSRSDAIRKASLTALSNFTGIPVVVENISPVQSIAVVEETPTARYHTVEAGESLWKIARQYKVKVDDVVLLNGIDKDKLYPGMTLMIP